MSVTTDAADGTEDCELDYRALTEYLTVLEDGDVRARSSSDLYTVTSQSQQTYLVDITLPACECADFQYRDRTCKHIRRVQFATGRREIPEWIDESDIDEQLGIHVDDVQDDSDDVDRGEGVETDGGEDVQGAIDQDFADAERDYYDQLEAALEGINTEPMAGGVAIDLITRQPLFIRRKVADTLAEYYDENGFDLATYNEHPFMPVRADDAVFECVFIEGPKDGHSVGKTYDYPRGRLMTVPVDLAWRDVEVGQL